jgi:putative exosortase-associated protein (TIGR04073 family)
MKKILITAIALITTCTCSIADIQAPPGSSYTSSRKLGRAISNILYGVVEIPEQIVRKNSQYGGNTGWPYGAVTGTRKAFSRIGYGFYELITFRCPTYHGTFKPPYQKCGTDFRGNGVIYTRNNALRYNGLYVQHKSVQFEAALKTLWNL